MAKLGSWGRAVQGKSQRQGSRRSKGGGFIGNFGTEVGARKRFVIPTFTDKDGNTGIFLQERGIHDVKKRGTIVMKTKNGNEFTPYAVGTSHPYKQPSFAKTLEIAERGDVDVFSKLATLTETDRWAKVNALGNDKNSSEGKEEFKNFMKDFDKDNLFLEESSYKDGEGEWHDVTEAYILILELETRMVTEKRARGIERETAEVVLDDQGLPKYEPKFWRVSTKRLGLIQSAVDMALDNEVLQDSNLHPYIENEGTDAEQTVYIGWVELEINFPYKEGRSAAMESARDASISAVNANSTVVTEDFVSKFAEDSETVFDKATRDFATSKRHLEAHGEAEQLEMLSAEARDYYNYLIETYKDESKAFDERLFGYYENIKKQANNGGTAVTETVKDVAEDVKETVEEVKETVTEKVEETKDKAVDVKESSKDKLDELLGEIDI